MHMTTFFLKLMNDDKGLSKLKLAFKIIENEQFLLIMVYVNETKQK